MKSVILASGGMDSFITWFLYARYAENIFVDLGQPYREKEMDSLAKLSSQVSGFKVHAVSGPNWSAHELPNGIIPMRNAMLVLMAAQYGDDIILGVLEGEVNSDKSPEFMQAIGATMSISGRGQYWNDYRGISYNVRSPIIGLTKTQLIRRYIADGGNVDNLLLTVSCYSGSGGKQCGACVSCFKRWVALTNNKIDEEFDVDPKNYGSLRNLHLNAYSIQQAHPYWSAARVNEIVLAMERATF